MDCWPVILAYCGRPRSVPAPIDSREVCSIACIACRICEKNCPVQAITVVNNLAMIDYAKCTQCGICERGCPVKPAAIHPKASGQPVDDDRCIHCYCCHEFCPSHAIELHAPWLARHLPLDALANSASRMLGYFASFGKRPRQ